MLVGVTLGLMLVATPDYHAQMIADLTAIQHTATALEEAIGADLPSGVAAAVSRDLLNFCPIGPPTPCQRMRLATDAPSLVALAEAVRIGFSVKIASGRGWYPESTEVAEDLRKEVADFTTMAEADTAFLLKLRTLLQSPDAQPP